MTKQFDKLNKMKQIIFLTTISFALLFSCTTPDDEKKLKSDFDKLEQLANSPEAKLVIMQRYEEALITLRQERKEKEERSKISYTAENDVTDSILTFCDELWDDNEYNPAKFQVKAKEFKWKSARIEGRIAYIQAEENKYYFTVYYKRESIKLDWLNDNKRSILFVFNFDEPEKIMNLKEGQSITIYSIYDHSFISEDIHDKTYFFYFFNPIVLVNKQI